ncbi:hypothetical protein B0H11DRAFT_2303294 [Mycena galericulata]|nr:hypothetical protein B0H11DRAFT_2303294 [Mycena galericulata]
MLQSRSRSVRWAVQDHFPSWKTPVLRDLAVVARTCKTLRDPALDQLWHSAALVNLVCCMPPDLWAVDTIGNYWSERIRVRLLRQITPADGERAHAYARRVKHLFNPREVDLTAIFPTLDVWLPANLLADLQSLRWGNYEDNFHHIHRFIGPALTTIVLEDLPDAALSLLSTLATTSPNLKTVSIGLHPIFLFADFGRYNTNNRALEHLGGLPSLKALRVLGLPAMPLVDPRENPRTFQALCTLEIGDSDMAAITRFLGLCERISLSSFSVSFYHYLTAAEMQDLCGSFLSALSHPSLTALTLENNFDYGVSDPATYLVQSRTVRLLFAFINMTSLTFTSPVGIDLDDAAVSDLARAWPRLECLDLSSYFCSPTPPRLTLNCLHHFVRHCPRLEKLSLTLDGTVSPTMETHTASHCQRALITLDVQYSPISKPISLSAAPFLLALFPDIQHVLTARENEDNTTPDPDYDAAIMFHGLWKEVEAMFFEDSDDSEETGVNSVDSEET